MLKKWKVGTDLTKVGVKNIEGYNLKHKLLCPTWLWCGRNVNLMLVSGKEIEGYIQKLSQMARAAGIHMVWLPRPSVDVITGTVSLISYSFFSGHFKN